MREIAIVKDSKETLKKIAYNIRYGRKFRKINIDKSFSDTLINRSKDSNEREILHLISKSKNQEDFENNIKEYLKSKGRSIYASVLLIGNVTGKYVFNDFYYDSVKELNIDAFSKDNQELLQELKSHFPDYIINNNKRKNTFAERIKVGKSSIKDLSQDINEAELVKDFERVLDGNETNDSYSKPKIVAEYVMKTIGIYSKDDIKNNFDFILYDINNTDTNSLDERRKKYLQHNTLSNNQLRKIDELSILKQRLQEISGEKAKELLSRLNGLGNAFDENISELEDIYEEYELLYRQDLINNLYVPKEDVTVIENYKDLKPQLIHQFIRNPEKFRDMEIEKIKEKIISERTDGNESQELTEDEQKRLNKLINQANANLDQYKVNYTTNGIGTSYTDSLGFDRYHSDTSNQISASAFEGKEFINSSAVGIIGIGFNRETLEPEAIAISANSYKTTNKGLNNLEYDEKNEFKEMSAPFSELLKAKGQSEVVIHRRGMDFDTKASYIFATIDSSNLKQTNEIMKQIEQIREKEGLKVVIYDVYKIRESLEQSKQEHIENEKNKNTMKQKSIDEIDVNKSYFHFTETKNLPSIEKYGLKAQVGDASTMVDDKPRVCLSKGGKGILGIKDSFIRKFKETRICDIPEGYKEYFNITDFTSTQLIPPELVYEGLQKRFENETYLIVDAQEGEDFSREDIHGMTSEFDIKGKENHDISADKISKLITPEGSSGLDVIKYMYNRLLKSNPGKENLIKNMNPEITQMMEYIKEKRQTNDDNERG